MNKNKGAIDIVIPVYNGYEDIQLCMDSIRRHTDLGKHRVLLINDCSPDERIRPWLDAQAGENVVVLHNEKKYLNICLIFFKINGIVVAVESDKLAVFTNNHHLSLCGAGEIGNHLLVLG